MWRRVLTGLAVVMAALAVVAPAWAAFSGRPGLLAYDILADYDGIYTVRPDGTGERRILPGAQAFEWSPDGRRLVYNAPSGLSVARADGTRARRVLTKGRARVAGRSLDGFRHPAWAPAQRATSPFAEGSRR